jgi:WD40 repeat protein
MNNYMSHLLLLLATVCICVSCKNHDKVSFEGAAMINVQPKATNAVDSFFIGYHYITLETNDDNLISDIDKIQIDGNKLWILDKKKRTIYLFDNLGNYIRKLHQFGNGPGSYLNIADFQVIDNKIYVLSRGNRKIIVYNDEGNFLEEKILNDFYDFFYIRNNSVVLYANFSNDELYNVVMFDMNSKSYGKRFLPYPSNQGFSFSRTPFNLLNDGEILLTQPYDYTIYTLNTDSLNAFVTLHFDTKDRLPDDIFERGFYNNYRELVYNSLVRRIEVAYRKRNTLYIAYVLDYVYHLTKIDMMSGSNTTLKLEYNDEVPYIFERPLYIDHQYMVNYSHASSVLMFDENFKSDKNVTGVLKAEDNPVIFFNKLRYE